MPIQDITQATIDELHANATEFIADPGHTRAHKVWRANAASSAVAAIASANAAASLQAVQATAGQFTAGLDEVKAENAILASELTTLQATVAANANQVEAALQAVVEATTASLRQVELQVGRLRASGHALGRAVHAGLRQLDATLGDRLDRQASLSLRVANAAEVLLVEAPQILEHRSQGPYTLEEAIAEIDKRLAPFDTLADDLLQFARDAQLQDALPTEPDFRAPFGPTHDEAALSRELARRGEVAARWFVIVAMARPPAGAGNPPPAAAGAARARKGGAPGGNEQP